MHWRWTGTEWVTSQERTEGQTTPVSTKDSRTQIRRATPLHLRDFDLPSSPSGPCPQGVRLQNPVYGVYLPRWGVGGGVRTVYGQASPVRDRARTKVRCTTPTQSGVVKTCPPGLDSCIKETDSSSLPWGRGWVLGGVTRRGRLRRHPSTHHTRPHTTLVNDRPQSSTLVHIRQHSSASIHVRRHTSTVVHTRRHTSTFVHTRPHSSSLVHFRPQSSTSVHKPVHTRGHMPYSSTVFHIRPRPSTLVQTRPHSSTLDHTYPHSSTPVHTCPHLPTLVHRTPSTPMCRLCPRGALPSV